MHHLASAATWGTQIEITLEPRYCGTSLTCSTWGDLWSSFSTEKVPGLVPLTPSFHHCVHQLCYLYKNNRFLRSRTRKIEMWTVFCSSGVSSLSVETEITHPNSALIASWGFLCVPLCFACSRSGVCLCILLYSLCSSALTMLCC